MKPHDDVMIMRPLYLTNLVFHRRDQTVNRFRDYVDLRARLGYTIRVWIATRCGLPLAWVQWDLGKNEVVRDGRSGSDGTMIRFEYAKLFARPCKKCFPWGA